MNYFDVLLAKKLEDTRDPVVKGLSVTENGRYSEENTVYDVVVVDVPETRLTTLNATANGTYTPQEGEAYNEVNVDVPLPSNAYLLKSLTGLPQDIATFTDGADAPLNALTASIELSCAGADIIVSENEIINNKTPYLFRKSAGGNRVLEKLIGGTIAWNQMIENGDFSNGLTGWTIFDDGASTITASNNEATITGLTTYNDGIGIELTTVPGHIYYVSASVKSTGNAAFFDSQHTIDNQILPSTKYERYEHIISVGTLTSQFFILSKQSINTVNIKNVMCIDITRVFGNGAQYIYGLEQSTAGAGVAYFRQMFPNDYYAYDSGSLQSVNVANKKAVGFNQWDEEWELGDLDSQGNPTPSSTLIRSKNFISVVSSITYYFKSNVIGYFAQYDANKIIIGKKFNIYAGTAFTTASNARYIKFILDGAYGTTYNHDICINISNASKNGTYEAYEEHTYAFDSDLTLRGLPKLDANNNLYYDGDVYESDGTVTRKYGVVDLGSLTWTYASSNTRFYSTDISTLAKKPSDNNSAINGVTAFYMVGSVSDLNSNDKILAIASSGNLFIKDTAYTDATTFKTAMNGVYLVYELATPTTESADPYTNPQIVDADGTEEFVDHAYSQSTRDVAVPVGHDSYYYDGTLYSRDFPTTISSGSYDIINGVITSGQNTYNTTPLPIRSLVGNNNIYVDCGDITNLEYFAKEQHE